MSKIRILLAAVAVPVTTAALVLGAQAAQASTPGCTNGAYLGYCATQADSGTPVLVLDSFHQGAGVNNPVIGWTDSTTDPGTDFFQLAFAGDNSLGVMFDYAPGGTITRMCAADPGDGLVVLRSCNGSNFQRWVAAQVGSTGFFTWTNRATHRILAASFKGSQLRTVAPPATPAGTEVWKFSN